MTGNPFKSPALWPGGHKMKPAKPADDYFLYRDVSGETRVIIDPEKAKEKSPLTKWQLHQVAHPELWRPRT